MKIILVRHGETEENKNSIILGHTPGKLTEKGIEQARAIAEKLKNENFDAIYSSDLARAKDTADFIKEFHECPFIVTDKLRERDYGELTGKTKKELKIDPSISAMILEIGDGENHEDIFNRARDFILELLDKHENQNLLLVAHNGINKAIEGVLSGKSIGDLKDGFTIPNGGELIFNINKGVLI